MKHQSLEQIALDADFHPGTGMSRRQRLERWAELLERQPHRRLSTIEGTELGGRGEREAKRADGSPLTVAFEDPILRVEGLRGDRVGDAVEFFDLSHEEVHYLVCYCHYGRTVAAGAVAAHVRTMARQNEPAASPSPPTIVWFSLCRRARRRSEGLSAAATLGLVFLAF